MGGGREEKYVRSWLGLIGVFVTILLSAFVYIMLQATHKPTQLTKFLSKGTEFSSQTKT